MQGVRLRLEILFGLNINPLNVEVRNYIHDSLCKVVSLSALLTEQSKVTSVQTSLWLCQWLDLRK